MGKTGCWTREAKLFAADEYVCSSCGYKGKKMLAACPECNARMKGSKYDPKWIDELEMPDAIFDD